MKNYSPIGKLGTPTLVYSMGVVLFSLPNIQKYIEEIQDVLRDDYPAFGKLDLTITTAPSEPSAPASSETIVHYLLNDPNAKWGIIISSERITLHTKAYENFTDFGARFRNILDKFLSVTKLKFYSGVAFRHIDNIKPLPEEKDGLSACINSSFLAPLMPGDEVERQTAMHEYKYRIGNRNIVSRLVTLETHEGPMVPADARPYFFTLNDGTEPINQLVPPPYVLADFEANNVLIGSYQKLDTEQIISELDVLHRYASNAYRNIMLPSALERRK